MSVISAIEPVLVLLVRELQKLQARLMRIRKLSALEPVVALLVRQL